MEIFQGLYGIEDLTFGKKLNILYMVVRTRMCFIMFNLYCSGFIFQISCCFFINVIEYHSWIVKTSRKNIFSLLLGDDDAICKKLQSKVLAIWRKG